MACLSFSCFREGVSVQARSCETPRPRSRPVIKRYWAFTIITIILILIPTAPRIPPHHPAQREERKGVMSLVGQLLKSLSCFVAKLCSVLGCSLVE